MNFVPYEESTLSPLTNQFTMTYGMKGSGKSTFGFSMNCGEPMLVIDLDRRSYSARRAAMLKWGVQIVEIPGLEVRQSDSRSMDEILGKKSVTKKSKSGSTYDIWVMDKKAATDVVQLIEGGLTQALEDPDIKSIFIDDAKVLGSIWASSWSEDGRISSINRYDWGEIYAPLDSLVNKLTRTGGCTKDVLFSHHMEEKRNEAGDRTGKFEPKWIDRLVKHADNVIEHYVSPSTFELGIKFTGKVPADNAAWYGRRVQGLEYLNYDLVKMGLLEQIEIPEPD